MTGDTFIAVDEYIDELFAPEDDALRSAQARARAAGLPEIQVSANQGKLLYLLARLVGECNFKYNAAIYHGAGRGA